MGVFRFPRKKHTEKVRGSKKDNYASGGKNEKGKCNVQMAFDMGRCQRPHGHASFHSNERKNGRWVNPAKYS